jgi:beta-phosphoglucomutase-like phosphatase (HAD superfamily)
MRLWRVNNIVYTAYEKEVQPKEGVRELLDTLQVNGIKMAVATSTDRPMVEAALKRTGLFSYFEQIFTCTEVGKGKVAPDIYYAAADILGKIRWCLRMHCMRSRRQRKQDL